MWRWIIITGVVGLLAGCASPPPHYTEFAANTSPIRSAASLSAFQYDERHHSEPTLQGAHPVDFYVGIALERNPQIDAARRGAFAQLQTIPQVTALDDPMLSDTFMPFSNHSLQTAAGRATNTLALSQRLPWFGTLYLRGEVAAEEARMAWSRLAQTELKVIEEVNLAYYDIYFYQQAIDITRENRRLLEDLLQIADARYRTGETSQQDVLRAQVELDRVDNRLIDLLSSLEQAQADLVSLLNANPDDQPAAAELVPSSVPEEIDRLYDLAIQCRPELEERLAAIVRDGNREQLASLRFYPDVTVGMSWQALTTGGALSGVATGNDNLTFVVGANLPIWRNKLRAGVREARQRTLQSARLYDSARDDTFREIRQRMAQAQALEEQITLFRESIIPRSDQALQISIADYRVGRVSFLQLLDNWIQLLTLDVQLVRLEANLEQTLASLERAVGCAITDFNPPVPDSQTNHPMNGQRGEPMLPSGPPVADE